MEIATVRLVPEKSETGKVPRAKINFDGLCVYQDFGIPSRPSLPHGVILQISAARILPSQSSQPLPVFRLVCLAYSAIAALHRALLGQEVDRRSQYLHSLRDLICQSGHV